MPVIYRRARGGDTWHFRADCSLWPEIDFEEEARTPSAGVCCVECTYWPASTSRSSRTHIAAPVRQVDRQLAALDLRAALLSPS